MSLFFILDTKKIPPPLAPLPVLQEDIELEEEEEEAFVFPRELKSNQIQIK